MSEFEAGSGLTPERVRSELQAYAAVPRTLPFRPPSVAKPDLQLARKAAVLLLFSSNAAGAPQLLLTQRAPHLSYHPGEVSFPGGGFEPGDDNLCATAVRETTEETGVRGETVEVLGALAPIHIPISNNLVTPVLGWWLEPTALQADLREAQIAFQVPLATLLNPQNRVTSVLKRSGKRFKGPAFQVSDATASDCLVWGFTGIVLAGLFDELGWTEPWDTSVTAAVRRD